MLADKKYTEEIWDFCTMLFQIQQSLARKYEKFITLDITTKGFEALNCFAIYFWRMLFYSLK